MKFRWWYYILLLLMPIIVFCEDKYLSKLIYRFIIENEDICGNQFDDPNWVPAIHECSLECEPTTYICMDGVHTTNQQYCKALSMPCVNGIRRNLEWSEIDQEQMTTTTARTRRTRRTYPTTRPWRRTTTMATTTRRRGNTINYFSMSRRPQTTTRAPYRPRNWRPYDRQRNYPPETTPDPRFSEEEQESFVTDQGSNESEDADRNLNSIRDNERNAQDYRDYTDQTADQREFDNRVEQRRINDREDTRERFGDRRDQREFDDRIEPPDERIVIDGIAEERRSGLARSANYPRPNQSGGGPAERNAQKHNQREPDQRAPPTIASPPATRPRTSQTEVSPYAPTQNPQSQTYYTEKAKTFRPVDPSWQSESSFVQAPSNADYDSSEAGGHPPGFVQEIAFGENEGKDQGPRQGREQGQEQGRDDYEELVRFPADQQKEAEGPPPNRNPNQNFDYNNGAESQSYSDEMAPPQEGYKGYEAMAPNTQSTNQSPRGKFDGYNKPNRYDPQHEYDHESSELGSESDPPIETTPSFGPATMNRRPRVMIYALGDDRNRPTNEFRNYRTDSSTASTPTTPFYKTRQTTDYEEVPSTIPPYYEPPMTFPPPPDHSDPHPPSFYPPAYNMKPFPAPSKPAPRDYYTKPQGRVNFENLAKEMEHNARISSAEESRYIPRKITVPQSEHFEIFTRVPPPAAAQEVQRSTPESNFDMSPTVPSINGRSNAEIYFHGYKRQYEQKEQREQQLQEDQKQSKIIAEMPTEQSVDKASSCCQWALHGLCDRNWKKVRPLCPKSCGTLVCEEIEGIKSCTRILDVDVEQCFRSMHFARYFGLKTAANMSVRKTILKELIDQRIGLQMRKKRRRRLLIATKA